MAVHAVRGKLYVTSITGATGASGTLLGDIDADLHQFSIARQVRIKKTGLAPDEVRAFYFGHKTPVLRLKLRDVSAADINLIFTGLDNSGGVQGSGTGVAGAASIAATRDLIIRPDDTTQRYLYMKAAALSPSQPEVSITYSDDLSVLDEVELHLIPTRAAGGTEPAWAWDTSANINALYAALS